METPDRPMSWHETPDRRRDPALSRRGPWNTPLPRLGRGADSAVELPAPSRPQSAHVGSDLSGDHNTQGDPYNRTTGPNPTANPTVIVRYQRACSSALRSDKMAPSHRDAVAPSLVTNVRRSFPRSSWRPLCFLPARRMTQQLRPSTLRDSAAIAPRMKTN